SPGKRGIIDKFRGRLIWPIADLTGDVIAFGARKLRADDNGPKYLNTPETPLFRKSTVLYGADLARREISQRRQAVIVEGYTDVMACHLAGIGTAVATSGTSFGEGHIQILRRLLMDDSQFRGEVIFTFDGDAAGQRAALRAFGMEEKFVTQTFVAVQPDGLDPCDLRLAKGDAAVRDLIAQREPLFQFAILSVVREHDLDTAEGRLAALDAAAPIIGRIKDRGLRQMYAVNLDRWTGIMDERFVAERIRQHASDRPAQRRSRAGAAVVPPPRHEGYDPRDPVLQIEREALKLAVQRPALCGPVFDALGAGSFTAPPHVAAFGVIAGCGGAGGAGSGGRGGSGREWAQSLVGAAPDDRSRAFLTELAVEPLRAPRADGEPDARYADEVLAKIEELAVSRQIAQIKSRLQRLNPVTEQAEYNRMFGDLVALEQRRKVLSGPAAGAV
ncbi:MAG TPA: toprim domain-containing protein, partial [Streptosporangiaceae bacterium]